MKFMPITLPPGLERNGTPYDTTGRFWDMSLFRWVSGSARPVGGWTRRTETPLGEAVRRIFAWRKNQGELGTLIGTETKLYTDFGGHFLDITPPGIVPPVVTLTSGYGTGKYGKGKYGTPRAAGTSTAFAPRYAFWSMDTWGEDVLLLSSEDNRIYHYIGSTPDVAPVVIPNAMPTSPGANGALTSVAGGSLAATTYYVRSTWVTASGESLAAPETSLAVAVNNVLRVAAPASPPVGVTGWNVYVSSATGTETRQNSTTPLALGVAWTEPTSGLVAGVAFPTVAKPPMPLAEALAVTEERHVMICGATIGGEYFPHRIAWSSRETLDDWNFASVTNSAGFLDLTATSPLNWLVRVREGLLCFSSTEVFLIQYLGPPYYYNATKLASMTMMHPYSIAPFNQGNAMWMSTQAIYLYVSGAVQPAPCPVFNDVQVDFSLTWGRERAHASANGIYPEVWMFWPSANASECDKYLLFNFVEGWWGWGYLERTAMFPSGALRRPLAGTANGMLYQHEDGWTDAGLPLLEKRYLETGALGIGAGERVVDIKQALLATQDNFHDGGPVPYVKLQFFGRYTPDGNERVFGPYTPRRDGYTDTRVNAREVRVRYVGNVDDVYDIGTLRLDVSAGGGR